MSARRVATLGRLEYLFQGAGTDHHRITSR
jgi:hypothetical protein